MNTQTKPKAEFVVEPSSAWPPKYDPVTQFRVSPDIERFRGSDGVWYHANGIRDEGRSPKQDLRELYFNQQ